MLTIRELEHIAFFCTFFAVMFHYYDLKLPNLTLICEDGKTRQQLSFFFFSKLNHRPSEFNSKTLIASINLFKIE